jgi:hypothetical protein
LGGLPVLNGFKKAHRGDVPSTVLRQTTTYAALGRVDIHPKPHLLALFAPDCVVFFARYAASRLKKRLISHENRSKTAILPECQHALGISFVVF